MVSRVLLFISVLFFSAAANAASQINVDEHNVAIKGYDPVAYFTDGKPMKGDAAYSTEYQGAIFYFASAEHRDLFKAEPLKYMPEYGGYCAYGASNGYKVRINPEAWAIHNGKLYLNYTKKVQGIWDKDRDGYILEADKQWPKIKDNKVN